MYLLLRYSTTPLKTTTRPNQEELMWIWWWRWWYNHIVMVIAMERSQCERSNYGTLWWVNSCLSYPERRGEIIVYNSIIYFIRKERSGTQWTSYCFLVFVIIFAIIVMIIRSHYITSQRAWVKKELCLHIQFCRPHSKSLFSDTLSLLLNIQAYNFWILRYVMKYIAVGSCFASLSFSFRSFVTKK